MRNVRSDCGGPFCSSPSPFPHSREAAAGDLPASGEPSRRPPDLAAPADHTDQMVAAAASVYRRVLKAVRRHVGGGASRKHFREFVASEFRRPTGTEADAGARLRLAGDYAYLLTSVHSHKDLLFSYNIAVDRSEEMKKILNKSAASVGLQLPDVYQP
ncbi:uncharacterized protein LOC102721004 [Oryza brachyantha]|uniref:uncharacterized protein LOC102721004 n=1 Tax=Oryza brachyantha TaxID=4533 RepID=UPI001ADCB0F6|nr:uncharacterized protein LOC102721004 [Oryza brachyantha]